MPVAGCGCSFTWLKLIHVVEFNHNQDLDRFFCSRVQNQLPTAKVVTFGDAVRIYDTNKQVRDFNRDHMERLDHTVVSYVVIMPTLRLLVTSIRCFLYALVPVFCNRELVDCCWLG